MDEVERKIAEIVARPYARLLERGVDGVYTATILEFPGCISEGDTPDEAVRNVDEALAGIVDVMLEDGLPIPEPLGTREYSGRVVLRIPPSLHARAVHVAEREGVSLNRLLSNAVAEYVGAKLGNTQRAS